MKGNIIFLKGKNAAGNLVFYTRAGVQMARARAEFVRNPRTTAQVNSRLKLAFISEMAKGLAKVLKLGYSVIDDARVSARNYFVKDNYDLVSVSGTPAAAEIRNYEDVKLTRGGDIDNVAPGEANFDTPLTVSVAIDDGYISPDYGLATDKVVLVVYDKTLKRCFMSDTATRASDSASVEVPGMCQGDFVETYVFTMRPAEYGWECSETAYCGSGRIA